MLQGYWVITAPKDDRPVLESLLHALEPTLVSFEGRVLPVDAAAKDHVGDRPHIVQIVAFPSMDMAKACLNSQGYWMTARLREGFESFDLIVVEQADL